MSKFIIVVVVAAVALILLAGFFGQVDAKIGDGFSDLLNVDQIVHTIGD